MPVFCSINPVSKITTKPQYKIAKDIKASNIANFLNNVANKIQTTYFEPSLASSPDNTINLLDSIVKNNYEEIPTKTIKINKYNTKQSPWITQGLLNSIRKRDILYKNSLKQNLQVPHLTGKRKPLTTTMLF